MSHKYQHLLSPIKVGDTIFKNRLTASPSRAKFVQGSEQYPTEAMITHYANKARNGAAMVACGAFEAQVKIEAQKLFGHNSYIRYRVANPKETGGPFIGLMEHADDQESYLTQLTEAVHFYGAKAEIGVFSNVPPQYDVSTGTYTSFGGTSEKREELPVELMDGIAEDYAIKAAFLRDLGFDALSMPLCYQSHLLARFLSPLTNKRTDEYGGSPENRARFPSMVFDRIKRKCGRDFLIEVNISGEEPVPGGQTLEDTIEYAKLFEGHVDLLQLRAGDVISTHPTAFMPEPTPFLHMADALKKSGVNIAVVTIGGYHDLDLCEEVIASGKADFIAMARSWISNPEYGRMAYEGRGEDVVPCIRCEKCHTSSYSDPLASVCSVNPTWGLEHKIERMVAPPTRIKKVAVVGGGPAGMEAALVASGRGHHVTLYEKSDKLGGYLNTADNVSFKWPLRDFKNYLVRQIGKSSIMVHLNIEVTSEILKEGEYDVVLAAVGSEPIVPGIPGVDGKNVVFAPDIYGNEDSLAKDVVVVGGGEIGVETGMHLAGKGHNVTVLEMGEMLVPEAAPAHYYYQFKDAWEKLENFKHVLQARCTGIKANKVTYIDAGGVEHTVKACSVIIAVGMKAKDDLALSLYGSSDEFFIIGDCNKAGNVQKVIRSAFSIASML